MKNYILLFLIGGIIAISCSPENEITPLTADFDVEISGESPEAQLVITNKSSGASTYIWEFDEGASVASSDLQNPELINVDKSGMFSITLIARNGTEEKEVSKEVNVPGYDAVKAYSDLEFALNSGHESIGRLFSFETDKMYLDTEINSTSGSKIHLAFGSMSNTMYYFDSPSASEFNVPEATSTKVRNYESDPQLSITTFDNITDDREIKQLVISHGDDSFGNSSIPNIVLFELSDGRRGAIKTKNVNDERLLVDIKIQKYIN